VKAKLVKIARVVGQVAILIVLILSGGYYLVTLGQKGKVELPTVSDCKLQQQLCSSRLPGGAEVEFEITPKNPDPSQSLQMMVRFKQLDPDSVSVKFQGRTMDMGLLEYSLVRKDNETGEVEFHGEGGLSVCVYGRMEWIVLVKIVLAGKSYDLPFEMETNYLPSSPVGSGDVKI